MISSPPSSVIVSRQPPTDDELSDLDRDYHSDNDSWTEHDNFAWTRPKDTRTEHDFVTTRPTDDFVTTRLTDTRTDHDDFVTTRLTDTRTGHDDFVTTRLTDTRTGHDDLVERLTRLEAKMDTILDLLRTQRDTPTVDRQELTTTPEATTTPETTTTATEAEGPSSVDVQDLLSQAQNIPYELIFFSASSVYNFVKRVIFMIYSSDQLINKLVFLL